MSAADEQHLIVRAREGDGAAFRVLVERFMKQAYNIAYGFVRDHDDAEDIAQESFVRIYRSIHKFRGDAEFCTWLYRIVTNLSFDRIKQKRRSPVTLVPSDDLVMNLVGHNPDNAVESDVHAHIERALHQLPTLQRATVILRHLNGLSTKQVSGILGCSEGTVKTHLHRGLKKMRKMLYFLNEP